MTLWYEELRLEREKIAGIRNIWIRKKIQTPFERFYDWYLTLERKCEYCGITEAEISLLLDNKQLDTKRIGTRGRSLEFDRKKPDSTYEEYATEVVLCCYWCNNAKTDTFTYQEFKEIGKSFTVVWKKRIETINTNSTK